MRGLLGWMDDTLSSLVPLLYLAGLLLGVVACFSGLVLDAGVAVGVALAGACEIHSFLAQRRLRAAWDEYARIALTDPRRETLKRQLRAQVAILSALISFSVYNSLAFVASTWRPAPGFLPGWLQIAIRGSVIPLFFVLSGFLTPLTQSAADALSHASASMLNRTLKATIRQWNARIKRARKSGTDLAPIAVALMLDSGDTDGARRITLIADGLARAEGVHMDAQTTPAAQPIPPTDGGTPVASSKTADDEGAQENAPRVLRMPTPGYESAERKVRAYLHKHPEASIKTLSRALRISESTASKYRRICEAETAARAR